MICASVWIWEIYIIVFVFVFRYVKSDRVKILMNLCFALLISYCIFLGGVDRTSNKVNLRLLSDCQLSLYWIYFNAIMKKAYSLLKHSRIRSWNQPVSCSRKQRLVPDWVWTHTDSDPKITSPTRYPLDHAATYFLLV